MPDRAFIRQTLIELLEADTGEKHDGLAEDASLREGLGLDSVDVVSIVSQIERRFHIRLSQEELEKLVTVADMLDLLQAKLAAAARSHPPPKRDSHESKNAREDKSMTIRVLFV